MRYQSFLIIIFCLMFFVSCTKQEKGTTVIISSRCFITASMNDSGSTVVSSFHSDTCFDHNTTYGIRKSIAIMGYAYSSSGEINSVYLQIDNYTGPGNYTISNDSINYVTAYFDVLLPASSGPSYYNIQASRGVISISSEMAGKAEGVYDISCGKFHFSGNFYIPIH